MKAHLHQKDHDLIEACKKGERAAQYKLYHQYAKAMLNTAYRILNDEEKARDVLQEAFLKVFQKIDQFRYQSTIGAWIKRVVVNTAINHGKKKGLNIVGGMEIVGEIADERPSAAEREKLEMDLRKARRGLAMLPDGYRTVLTLYLVEGYDHKEISEILGVALSTSLTQYNRGKKKLREIIQNMNDEDEQYGAGQDRKVLQGPSR